MSFRLLWRCKDEVRRKTGFSEKSERAVSNEAGREDECIPPSHIQVGNRCGYLNHSAGVRNGLTVSEANRLSNAGVFICALYESDSGTSISHFTRSNGIADAREAISLAEDLGMPTGNPIYFCIDTDVTKSQMTTYIVPYVQGILSELEGSGYKLGIYGPKPVCKYIRGTYSATERYMMICDNDWGQSGWSATERDFDDWNIRQYEWNQSLPGVSSVTIDKCESSTNGGGGWKL